MAFDWSSVVKPRGIPATPHELGRFEDVLGFALPNDYRRFLLTTNGGKILPEHEIRVPALACSIFVNYLLPLSDKSPFLGVTEARKIQTKQRLCLRQALEIGDDMGTGFYYLILDGERKGAVYFVFKDDMPMREGDWYSRKVYIPERMVMISQSFDALGRTVMDNVTKRE